MSQGWFSFGCIEYDNYIYVAGGNYSCIKLLNSAERYSILDDSWVTYPDLNVKRDCLTLVMMHPNLYAIGGSDSNMKLYFNTIEYINIKNPS